MTELLRIFIAEGAARAVQQAKVESSPTVETDHLEKILPQLRWEIYLLSPVRVLLARLTSVNLLIGQEHFLCPNCGRFTLTEVDDKCSPNDKCSTLFRLQHGLSEMSLT
ncbi:unnamed protein product [Porites evermanni]|uniref:Uncharacterized protein n=1 Tax=Porites evermanni TaxID=104178 RepID=A0ABN8MF83_9CNID|nr:unnamed protein product [Porites evermanni]